jgi:hypothetical protein
MPVPDIRDDPVPLSAMESSDNGKTLDPVLHLRLKGHVGCGPATSACGLN